MGKETAPGADERLRLRRGWLCFVRLQNTARLRQGAGLLCPVKGESRFVMGFRPGQSAEPRPADYDERQWEIPREIQKAKRGHSFRFLSLSKNGMAVF